MLRYRKSVRCSEVYKVYIYSIYGKSSWSLSIIYTVGVALLGVSAKRGSTVVRESLRGDRHQYFTGRYTPLALSLQHRIVFSSSLYVPDMKRFDK